MDPDTVFDRADVMREPGDLLPSESDGPEWVAIDPETGCKGVGDFEKAARTHLVYAVKAYYETSGESAPYLSVGKDRTFEMRWRTMNETEIRERLDGLLPF